MFDTYRVASLVRGGYTDGDIADIIDCSRSTVQRARVNLGLVGYSPGKKKPWDDPIFLMVQKILDEQIDKGTTAISREIGKSPQYTQYLIDAMAGMEEYAELIQRRKDKLLLNKKLLEIKQAKALMRKLYQNPRFQPVIVNKVREMRGKYPESIFWQNFPTTAQDVMWTYNPDAPVFVPFMGAIKITAEHAAKIVGVENAIDIRHAWCQGFDTDLAIKALRIAKDKDSTDDEIDKAVDELFDSAGWIGTESREGSPTESEEARFYRHQDVTKIVTDWVGKQRVLEMPKGTDDGKIPKVDTDDVESLKETEIDDYQQVVGEAFADAARLGSDGKKTKGGGKTNDKASKIFSK